MGEVSIRTEPAAARTSERLTIALVTYFVLIILVITVSPFDFGPALFKVSLRMKPSDMLLNVGLFLPLGFLLRGLGRAGTQRAWHAVTLAAAFSVLIEAAQIFIRGRYVSPIDVLTNTCGACAGIVLRERVERWALWQPQVVGRIGLDIPLVGLLYLLAPQLWLSSVGLVQDAWRSVTILLLGCAGSIVLVSLHRHRSQRGVRQRRFEAETLQRFLPVFAIYLVVAALWPPFRSVVPWHGAVGFLDRLNNTAVVQILLLLEQVGGFTLLGYALAEWRGRDEMTLSADLPRVALIALIFATLLEVAQGLLSGPGASVLRALLASGGAVYGAAVYHLARAHVRALRAQQPPRVMSADREAA